MNEIQKKIIEDNGLVEIKEEKKYDDKMRLIYHRLITGIIYYYTYNSRGLVISEKVIRDGNSTTERTYTYNNEDQVIHEKHVDTTNRKKQTTSLTHEYNKEGDKILSKSSNGRYVQYFNNGSIKKFSDGKWEIYGKYYEKKK